MFQVYATQARPGSTAAPPLFDVQVLLGKQDDDLPLIYARQVAEAIATDAAAAAAAGDGGSDPSMAAAPPVLVGVAMRDHSPEAFQQVLAALPQVRVW